MAKHHPDLVMCRKQPGIALGRLCEKCDGKCVICDSFVNPATIVHICDECNYGSFEGKCVVCGGQGVTDAYYCKECVKMGKDRDGCPKVVNLGSTKTDLFYERKKVRVRVEGCAWCVLLLHKLSSLPAFRIFFSCSMGSKRDSNGVSFFIVMCWAFSCTLM
jgi:PHD finger-like domain-containing protein 5A